MAPLPSTRGRCTHQVCLLLLFVLGLSTATLAAVVPTSHSSHNSSLPAPAPDRHGEATNDDVELLSSSSLFTGFFSVRGVDTQQQVTAGGSTIWRMDRMEGIVRVASKMLFCVFVVLRQILHAKRNHEEPSTMSSMAISRLVVVLSLGCVVLDLIMSHWVFLLVTFVYLFS
ncbi:hypothetical protein BS78_03G230700 [Paspalum vaginatum]|nr:hypothetical protein BS78_03G230700 [Paspalum vaginatum]